MPDHPSIDEAKQFLGLVPPKVVDQCVQVAMPFVREGRDDELAPALMRFMHALPDEWRTPADVKRVAHAIIVLARAAMPQLSTEERLAIRDAELAINHLDPISAAMCIDATATLIVEGKEDELYPAFLRQADGRTPQEVRRIVDAMILLARRQLMAGPATEPRLFKSFADQ